jgi:hypothetical protein
VQRPPAQRPTAPPSAGPPSPAAPRKSAPDTGAAPRPGSGDLNKAPEGPEPESRPGDDSESDADASEKKKKKLGGWRFFRLGVAGKFGYLNGTSQKEGLFDRDKTIDNAVMTGMVEPTGGGDLGETTFGGLAYGGIVDLEVVGLNVWLDFNKFINPGGMWSLLLGYDHEIGFNHWLRLDVGGGFGMMKVFLGDALEKLYLDRDDPTATNIGTTGMEFRGMADLHFRIAGPLFTGPGFMLGYHYLWSANASEVTKEKGLHYSAMWSLRVDLARRRGRD